MKKRTEKEKLWEAGSKAKSFTKVKIEDFYINDEVGQRATATKTAIILSEPSDSEELVMVQYTNGAIDYVPQDVITSEEIEYCEQCGEDLPKEHTCYTCCGNEITGEVEDIGLCPTCLEHI